MGINLKNGGYWLILIVIAVIYTLIEWRFPVMYDDWAFMGIYKTYAGNDTFSFRHFLEYCSDVRLHQNGRISNMLAPFTTIFTPWKYIFPAITGCCMAAIIAFVQKMACRHTASNPILFLALSWTLLLLLLPWRDSIFVADYSLNYILAAAISLTFIYLLIRFESGKWNLFSLVAIILLSVVAGGWHEGFSLTTTTGLCLYIISKKFRVSPQFYIITVVYLASALTFFYSPGMISRISTVIGDERIIRNPLTLGILYSPFILLAATYLSVLIFPKTRAILIRSLGNPFCIIGFGIILSGLAISLMPNQPPRSVLWPSLFCVVNILSLLAVFKLKHKEKRIKTMNQIFSAVLISTCILQGCVTLYWVDKYRKESDMIVDEFLQNDGGTIFYDIIKPSEPPNYTLKIPPKDIWQYPFNYFCLWLYKHMEFFAVVPTALSEADIKTGTPLPGNIDTRIINGFVVAPYRPHDIDDKFKFPLVYNAELTLKSNQKINNLVMEHPFITRPFLHSDGSLRSDTLLYYAIDPKILPEIKEFYLREKMSDY